MILVQGCSYSHGDGLDRPLKHRWPTLLSNMLQKEVVNISEGGKCNFQMYYQLFTWLMWAKRGKARMPETIIWQTTAHNRDGIRMWRGSGDEKFNNLNSQISNYNHRYYKPDQYGIGIKLQDRMDKAVALKDSKQIEEIKQLGYGEHLLCTDEYGNPISVQPIGDGSGRSYELKHCADIVALQALCKSLGVRLIILNYFGQPKEMKGDPLFEAIDRDDYVVYNSRYYGVWQEMGTRGFENTPCFHWNVDGNFFQADIVADFYKNNKQYVVSERGVRYNNQRVIHRYSALETVNHPLVQRIKSERKKQ